MTQPPTQHEPDLTVDTVSSLGDAALPKVAIVGRPNVGKSSLLNMLAGRRISIVDPTAGVTRDRVPYVIELPPTVRGQPARHCEMIDTGGYGVYSGEGELELLTEDVERQITAALNEAQLVLFVVDALMGITSLDKQFASMKPKLNSGWIMLFQKHCSKPRTSSVITSRSPNTPEGSSIAKASRS